MSTTLLLKQIQLIEKELYQVKRLAKQKPAPKKAAGLALLQGMWAHKPKTQQDLRAVRKTLWPK